MQKHSFHIRNQRYPLQEHVSRHFQETSHPVFCVLSHLYTMLPHLWEHTPPTPFSSLRMSFLDNRKIIQSAPLIFNNNYYVIIYSGHPNSLCSFCYSSLGNTSTDFVIELLLLFNPSEYHTETPMLT